MAKPRVFVSSTYYDLKHLRASLDLFIESLGYETILSEKGDIAYSPDMPLDESCYREVSNSDILVLIVGGRYGSEASSSSGAIEVKSFYDRYNSITKQEVEEAVRNETPLYILVESSVYSEYQTYKKNRTNRDINYAHVDSVNIFELINDLLSLPKNNPVQTFEKFSDIESWLRDQWAGLFRELLNKSSQAVEIAALNSQIRSLSDINDTFKSYLETIIRSIDKSGAEELIENETEKLAEKNMLRELSGNDFVSFMNENFSIPVNTIKKILEEANSFDELLVKISKFVKSENSVDNIKSLKDSLNFRDDLEEAMLIINKTPSEKFFD